MIMAMAYQITYNLYIYTHVSVYKYIMCICMYIYVYMCYIPISGCISNVLAKKILHYSLGCRFVVNHV